ncbi:MAG: asparagine synthase-related protein [Amaricoccus sp.]
MSIIVSAVYRREIDPEPARRRMLAVLQELTPERLRSSAALDVRDGAGHVQGTVNLPGHYPRRDLSLCQGKLYDSEETWWEPGTRAPDGSFAILREDADRFEAVSDPAGSRMLWYLHDDHMFVVSNSERAITMYTGRFALNRSVVPWVVSTGTRGLGASYNAHLRLLPPAAVASLDKASWQLQVAAEEIRFVETPGSREERLADLDEALAGTFANFGAEDSAHAVISLSGGCDSRALAAYLGRDAAAGWRSYSIGSAKAIAMPGSDASIAARVAAALGLRHRTIVTDPGTGDIGELARRFVISGEGRHDGLIRLDSGSELQRMSMEGVAAIVRGDEGFGWKPVAPTGLSVRMSMDLLLCGDIANLKPHLAAFGLDGHELPEELRRAPGESIETWRDRLYQRYRIPTLLAALTEHKAITFDTINPLLSRRALKLTRSLPDTLRTDKALFRELVGKIGPDVPFAGRDGAPSRMQNTRHPEVLRAVRRTLASPACEGLFGPGLARWLRAEIHPARYHWTRMGQVLGRVQRRYLKQPRGNDTVHLDPLRLAFRLFVATTMVEQLEADAGLQPADAQIDRAA